MPLHNRSKPTGTPPGKPVAAPKKKIVMPSGKKPRIKTEGSWESRSEAERAEITLILARAGWKLFEVSKFEGPCWHCSQPIAQGAPYVFWKPDNANGKSSRMHAEPCAARAALRLTPTTVSTPLSAGNPTTLSTMPRPPSKADAKKKETPNAADARNPSKPPAPTERKPKFARLPAHIKFN